MKEQKKVVLVGKCLKVKRSAERWPWYGRRLYARALCQFCLNDMQDRIELTQQKVRVVMFCSRLILIG